jgi:hypothetical protein
MKHKSFFKLLSVVLLVFALSGCSQIANDPNFTLEDGEAVTGNLIILSQNATLTPGSFVDGSVIMVCCNLIVEGEVAGDVFLLTGNIMVKSPADVKGDVSVLSGNVSK